MPVPVGWDVARASVLYREGWTVQELQDEFGVSGQAIRRQLVKAGVDLRVGRLKMAEVDTEYVLWLREQKGLSWRAIGAKVGMTTPGATSRYHAGVRDRERQEQTPEPSQPMRWADLFMKALGVEPVIEVMAVVRHQVGHEPTRVQMIAARRAAARLAEKGTVRKLHADLISRTWTGSRGHVLLARPDATTDQINELVRSRGGRADT